MSAPSVRVRSLALGAALLPRLATLDGAPAFSQDFYAGRSIELLIGGARLAATISMGASWRGISAVTSPGIRPSCRRTCRAPAADGWRIHRGRCAQGRHRDRQHPAGHRDGAAARSQRGPSRSIRRRSSISPTPTTARASASPAASPGSRTLTTRVCRRACIRRARPEAIPHTTTPSCTSTRPGAVWDVVFGYSGTAGSFARDRTRRDRRRLWSRLGDPKSQRPDWMRDKTVIGPDTGCD